MAKIVVGASTFASTSQVAINMLKEKGYEVILNPYGRKLTEAEVIDLIKDADGLLAGLEPLNERVFSQAKSLKAVARIGIGMENVDQSAAKKYNIKISNTPDAPTRAVAEMTLAALFSISRGIPFANADVHKGIWKKRMGFSLEGKTALIIGYGRIGKKTAELFRKNGIEVMAYDPFAIEKNEALGKYLGEADIISIHASGNEEIIGANEFERMKDGVVILNSARGGLINEEALYDALNTGKVLCFWGDALWEEPYSGNLIKCENAVLTPHISTYTSECREEMEIKAVKNLLEDLNVL